MSVSGDRAVSGLPRRRSSRSPGTVPPARGTVRGAAEPDFGRMVPRGLEKLQARAATADNLAVKAATGDLTTSTTTRSPPPRRRSPPQLTVAVRNKAVEAFNEIMRMQV